MPGGVRASDTLDRFLLPKERELLQQTGPLPPESLHGMLAATPSLAARGIRRDVLMALLEPALAPAYVALVKAAASAPPPALSVSDAATLCWPQTAHALPEGTSATDPLTTYNLLKGLPYETWLVRDQAGAPTCVSEASAACIELMSARQSTTFMPLSPRFLDDRLRARRATPPPPGYGTVPSGTRFAKLGEAARILEEEGICEEKLWEDTQPPAGTLPDAAAHTDALKRRFRTAFYLDQPPGAQRLPGLARRLYAELRQRRPVAVALPGFREKGSNSVVTSWSQPDVMHNGQIPDRLPEHEDAPGSGHAVCLVGFRQSAEEPAGGYFLFRDSRGTEFGAIGDDPTEPPGPRSLPARGYGTISATHLEAACWEAVSFALQPATP